MGQAAFFIGAAVGGFIWTFVISLLIGIFAYKDDEDPDRNARYTIAIAFLIVAGFFTLLRGLGPAAISLPFYLAGALLAYFPRRALFRRRASKHDSIADIFD